MAMRKVTVTKVSIRSATPCHPVTNKIASFLDQRLPSVVKTVSAVAGTIVATAKTRVSG